MPILIKIPSVVTVTSSATQTMQNSATGITIGRCSMQKDKKCSAHQKDVVGLCFIFVTFFNPEPFQTVCDFSRRSANFVTDSSNDPFGLDGFRGAH
ncbi:hypothetical protein CDAR_164841 [Caerostris darwini]|uniref:Uncharacterized protein n=1 Tax=Caerostris darwini TaxID=1538125 RepID=A0AAV4T2A1_9ARAC|nr:hypothetical protein CDAR_164841 [Caerostris darwini]